MNPVSKSSSLPLVLVSCVMLCSAAAIWAAKSRDLAAQELQNEKSQLESKRAASALLLKSFRADNELSYSAVSHTVAFMGGKKVESKAQITRAPRHLSIKMLSGPLEGAQSGFSQRWFWRQDAGKTLRPYAEVSLDANQMAAKRFELLTRNYAATTGEKVQLDGRAAQIIELRPVHLSDGARGPARRLFICEQSGLTLRVDSFNCDLKPTMRSSLSQLNLRPQIRPVTFEPPKTILSSLSTRKWQGEEMGTDFQRAAQTIGIVPPRPTFLPPGFALDGYGVHRCLTTGKLQPASFARYSDGLNCLMVFAFKPIDQDIEKTMRGSCDFGPGAMISREDGDGRLVAVGDLPAKTLERVLASAKFEMTK
jgi:negative regulator of sigma E activity